MLKFLDKIADVVLLLDTPKGKTACIILLIASALYFAVCILGRIL